MVSLSLLAIMPKIAWQLRNSPTARELNGDGYSFKSSCPDARLAGSFKGDLAKSYTLTADTSFELNGKTEVQHNVLNGTFQGACPADMAPGVKKMRGGMKMKSLYINR